MLPINQLQPFHSPISIFLNCFWCIHVQNRWLSHQNTIFFLYRTNSYYQHYFFRILLYVLVYNFAVCLDIFAISWEGLSSVKTHQLHLHSATITHNQIISHQLKFKVLAYILFYKLSVLRGARCLPSNTTTSSNIENNKLLNQIQSGSRYCGGWIVLYGRIPLITQTCSWFSHIPITTSSIRCRFPAYIIQVACGCVWWDTCFLVLSPISNTSICTAYLVSFWVTGDSCWCIVHRCRVWCALVSSSWRWLFISCAALIICVISSELLSTSFHSSLFLLRFSTSSPPSLSTSHWITPASCFDRSVYWSINHFPVCSSITLSIFESSSDQLSTEE